MKLKEEVINQERMYRLLSSTDGALFLDVVCGGIAMYNVIIALTDEQKEQYEEEGEIFLDDLAYRVGKGEFKEQIMK